MSEIEWRTIPGWEGLYEVSEDGQVRTVTHTVMRSNGAPQTVRQRMLKPFPSTGRGYETYKLYRDGKGQSYYVHTLVALAFIGPRPSPDVDICHWDDDRANNHYSNLRYGTKSENMRDRVRNRKHHHTVKTHCPQGHEYSGDNLVFRRTRTGVARVCRTCRKARQLRWYYRQRARQT